MPDVSMAFLQRPQTGRLPSRLGGTRLKAKQCEQRNVNTPAKCARISP
jgi:hypothetical protein